MESKESPSSQPSPDALTAYRAAHHGKAPAPTRGEMLFNVGNYFGLGWVVNAILSTFAADQAKHGYTKNIGDALNKRVSVMMAPRREGKFAQEEHFAQAERFFDALKEEFPEHAKTAENKGEPIKGLFKEIGLPSDAKMEKLYTKGVMKEASAEEFNLLKKTALARNNAAFWVSFGMLNLGGWAVLVPMKLLEDRKEKIVRKLDQTLHAGASPTQQVRIDARHEAIHEEPKQSWGSELLSRAISTPLVFALYNHTAFRENTVKKLGVTSFEGMEHYAREAGQVVENTLSPSGLKKVENFLEKTPKRLGTMQEIERDGETLSIGKQRLHNVTRFAFLDVTYALMMASLVFVSTRVLAPIMHVLKKPHHDAVKEAAPNAQPHAGSFVASSPTQGTVIVPEEARHAAPATKVMEAKAEPMVKEPHKATSAPVPSSTKRTPPEVVQSHRERIGGEQPVAEHSL